MRWEKTTRPFLRTSEFLWQEGHTVHASEEEAEIETQTMLGVYKDFAENCLAIPVLTGRKTDKEKFAGAVATYGMEAMMLDGKSLQAGTSHYLGQNFAKAFDMKFLDKDGTLKYGYSTSWGVSTRLIGALIMAHGDQRGLVIPPVVAPIQVIIVPVAMHKDGVLENAQKLCDALCDLGIRAEVDKRDATPGWKFNEWEMKGVPVRIEVGPRDIENGKMMTMRRDTLEKAELNLFDAVAVKELLATVQKEMLEKSRERRDSRIVWANSVEELLSGVDNKCFVKAPWCGCRECEEKIKEQTQATARVIAEDSAEGKVCAVCGKKATKIVYFARAY
jgi:prolyl-tRNA synthetase